MTKRRAAMQDTVDVLNLRWISPKCFIVKSTTSCLEWPSGILKSKTIGGFTGLYLNVHVDASQ
jgi:hypothetical protein